MKTAPVTPLPLTRREVAISPCPNDTFAFYSLIHCGKYAVDFLDIEELNRALLEKKYPIAKGSFAIMHDLEDYAILPTGAAIGDGVGPVLVSAASNLGPGARIALPGEHTTAHRLFQFWRNAEHPGRFELRQMPFFDLLPALREGRIDAAVLIHEGRFVYAAEGFQLVEDLGAYWEKKTGCMIPLGCVYADRSLCAESVGTFVTDLRQSLTTSLSAYREKSALYTDKILPYMQQMAREKNARVTEQHVDTYVTADTMELSPRARESIDAFGQCLKKMQPERQEHRRMEGNVWTTPS